MSRRATPSTATDSGELERVRFLQSPAAHRDHAGPIAAVETIETHMAWIFLAGDHALKMKKPVRYPFLDFSTLAARERVCREELRLNARLAPGVYLGLLALQRRDGGFALGPESRQSAAVATVDWLVLMRRLPARRMLDRLIATRGVTPDDIAALARVLAEFYRRLPAVELAPADYVARFRQQQAVNREVLLGSQAGLRNAEAALDGLDAALLRHAPLLMERAAGGHVVDGHGDLRPEHVCLESTPRPDEPAVPRGDLSRPAEPDLLRHPPLVIDALEFNAALRQVDPYDELGFLGLECEVAGAPWIGPQLLASCAATLGGAPPDALLHLYRAYRAQLRARLALAHLLESRPRRPRKWAPRAQRYLECSLAALAQLARAAAPGQQEQGIALNAARPCDCP